MVKPGRQNHPESWSALNQSHAIDMNTTGSLANGKKVYRVIHARMIKDLLVFKFYTMDISAPKIIVTIK